MPLIEIYTQLPATPQRCFDLCLDVDAHQASTMASQERVVAGVSTGALALGDSVTWSARHFGLSWQLTVEITAYDPPHRFVDEMRQGPFSRLRHEHIFEATLGGTRMTDRFDFASPLGALGQIVDALVMKRHLRAFLVARNAHLAAELAGAP